MMNVDFCQYSNPDHHVHGRQRKNLTTKPQRLCLLNLVFLGAKVLPEMTLKYYVPTYRVWISLGRWADIHETGGQQIGLCYLHNQIQNKNMVMIVKPVFLCDVEIGRNLCLKLEKVTSAFPCFPNFKNYLRRIVTYRTEKQPYTTYLLAVTGPMNNYRNISYRRNNYCNLCTVVMYNMAAMHRKDIKTEFQLKPTNQERSWRSCDKTRQSSQLHPRGALTV